MKTDPRFPKLHIVDHPLVQHKLSLMRDKNCSTMDFRRRLREVTMMIGYELTKDMPLIKRNIETPVASMQAPVLAGKKPVIIPVLRAGLGMEAGLLALLPAARVGHIGLFRNEKHEPVEYLVRMPSELSSRLCFIVDPMIATGHSAVHAVDILLKRGVPAKQIRFVGLLAAPEGIEVLQKAHPEVEIYVAALDEKLTKDAFITPGLGDAGDRIYGTL